MSQYEKQNKTLKCFKHNEPKQTNTTYNEDRIMPVEEAMTKKNVKME